MKITNNVPRETSQTLNQFVKLLLEWNEKINLIGKSTLNDVWERHVEDSAQLINLIADKNIKLIDIGSGAGFPGLILSFMGIREVHLIESDRRKVAFLKEAASLSPNQVSIHHQRSEDMSNLESDLITARAVAPLDKLFKLTENLIYKSKGAMFMKGAKYETELSAAKKNWKFEYELHSSITNPEARIILVKNLRKK